MCICLVPAPCSLILRAGTNFCTCTCFELVPNTSKLPLSLCFTVSCHHGPDDKDCTSRPVTGQDDFNLTQVYFYLFTYFLHMPMFLLTFTYSNELAMQMV